MKKIIILLLLGILIMDAHAQTLIATTGVQFATYGHNQRKIVRDNQENIYVVFSGYEHPSYVIKGVKFDAQTSMWSDPFTITEGIRPSIAITEGPDCKFHLICTSLDSVRQIRYVSSDNFLNWEQATILSDEDYYSTYAIADIDSAGMLNIIWHQENPDTTESLIYAKVSEGAVLERKAIITKASISDYAIANHLQYTTNDLFWGLSYNEDSVEFFHSNDGMQNSHSLYSAEGSQPGITFNSNYSNNDLSYVRLLYLNPESHLIEVEYFIVGDSYQAGQLPVGYVKNYCVDDIQPPIGYSFIFTDEFGTLYHAFSYGSMTNWCSVMDTIYGYGSVENPSVAYKHFNSEYVDFIWTEIYGPVEIYYKRDEKHHWTSIDEDHEKGKGFSITAGPNPFSDILTINIAVENNEELPSLLIYDANSKLVRQISFWDHSDNGYTNTWDGTDQNGKTVNSGLYILLTSVGNRKTARKILYQP